MGVQCVPSTQTVTLSLLPADTHPRVRRVCACAELPEGVVTTILSHTAGGISDDGRLCVLAATRWTGDNGEVTLRYCELSPLGERSPITDLIDRAGEPAAVLLPSLDGFAQRDVLKFVIWTVPGEDGWAPMPPTVQALKKRLAGSGVTILDHGARWCEILPPGVNKGSGVERMLATLGVNPADALACGDAENDVEMLALCGVGAAMANAQPDAIAAADVTVASNADDGVADAVHRFVLSAACDADGGEVAAPLAFYTLEMCPYAQRCWIVLEELVRQLVSILRLVGRPIRARFLGLLTSSHADVAWSTP